MYICTYIYIYIYIQVRACTYVFMSNMYCICILYDTVDNVYIYMKSIIVKIMHTHVLCSFQHVSSFSGTSQYRILLCPICYISIHILWGGETLFN